MEQKIVHFSFSFLKSEFVKIFYTILFNTYNIMFACLSNKKNCASFNKLFILTFGVGAKNRGVWNLSMVAGGPSSDNFF